MAIRLECVDRRRNMYRFYALDVQRDLFGAWTVVRHWGRIGRAGRQKLESYRDEFAARAARKKILKQKLNRGYLPVDA